MLFFFCLFVLVTEYTIFYRLASDTYLFLGAGARLQFGDIFHY